MGGGVPAATKSAVEGGEGRATGHTRSSARRAGTCYQPVPPGRTPAAHAQTDASARGGRSLAGVRPAGGCAVATRRAEGAPRRHARSSPTSPPTVPAGKCGNILPARKGNRGRGASGSPLDQPGVGWPQRDRKKRRRGSRARHMTKEMGRDMNRRTQGPWGVSRATGRGWWGILAQCAAPRTRRPRSSRQGRSRQQGFAQRHTHRTESSIGNRARVPKVLETISPTPRQNHIHLFLMWRRANLSKNKEEPLFSISFYYLALLVFVCFRLSRK